MPSTRTRAPRLANDADKYTRVVKGGKYQARPYVAEEHRRYNLGLFHTRDQARKAISEFWWGRRKPKFRFARPVRLRCGKTVWIAVVRLPDYLARRNKDGTVTRGGSHRVGDRFDAAEDAHAAAVAWVRGHVGPLLAWYLIEGGEAPISQRTA